MDIISGMQAALVIKDSLVAAINLRDFSKSAIEIGKLSEALFSAYQCCMDVKKERIVLQPDRDRGVIRRWFCPACRMLYRIDI